MVSIQANDKRWPIKLKLSEAQIFPKRDRKLKITLYRGSSSIYPMNTITILAMFAILAGAAVLAGTGITAFVSVAAQTTMDNATMAGNMTGGNMTGGNTTDAPGSVSGRYK